MCVVYACVVVVCVYVHVYECVWYVNVYKQRIVVIININSSMYKYLMIKNLKVDNRFFFFFYVFSLRGNFMVTRLLKQTRVYARTHTYTLHVHVCTQTLGARKLCLTEETQRENHSIIFYYFFLFFFHFLFIFLL